MNIGIVTTWFERGAAYVSKQFEEIISKKHNVFIFARGGESFAKGDPKWDAENVHWSQYPLNRQEINKKEFISWLRENAIDLVLFNEQQIFAPVVWCKEIGVKTVAYIDYYTERTIPFFDVYDALICNTKRHASAFENHHTVYYLPWGTDTDMYKPVSDDGKLVEEGKVTFFNSAGMNPLRKGTDTFIKALSLCDDCKNIKAIIHSQRKLAEVFPELQGTIEQLVSEGKLEIIEKTVSAPGLYYRADVYVYPSILDGIGLTVPEAIASGLACIASDNPPMNEFVNNECGSLIPVTRLYARVDGYYWPQCRCDVSALAQMIKDYATNPDMVIDKKRKARKYAEENLSFEKNADKITEILEKVRLTETSSSTLQQIRNYENRTNAKIMKQLIKYKLYLLPSKTIRKILCYRC